MAFDFINFIDFIQLYIINYKWPQQHLLGFATKGRVPSTAYEFLKW